MVWAAYSRTPNSKYLKGYNLFFHLTESSKLAWAQVGGRWKKVVGRQFSMSTNVFMDHSEPIFPIETWQGWGMVNKFVFLSFQLVLLTYDKEDTVSLLAKFKFVISYRSKI